MDVSDVKRGLNSHFMAKFWSIFRLVWIERMVYRVNFCLEILSGILSALIVVLLWMAIYRYSGKDVIGGYSLAEMVTYLLGAGLINSFILTTAENHRNLARKLLLRENMPFFKSPSSD